MMYTSRGGRTTINLIISIIYLYLVIMTSLHYVMQHWTEHFQLSVYYVTFLNYFFNYIHSNG